jgi:hypothetical protein
VRGVLRRAQGPHHAAVLPHVRVRGVCEPADADEKPSCPICRGAIQQTNKVFQS